jgi:hypothetical protein
MPLSKKAFSVLLAISGFADVKYIYRIIKYNEIGMVKITMYSCGFMGSSKRLNLYIK